MAEHGIFPPDSLQSNDPPKVFSLTLTTAYKRDQFLPLGQRAEMEFFITEWRWGQKVQRMIREATFSSANQNEAALHQKTGSSSAKSQLSCPGQQHRYCGFYAENSVQLVFLFCFFYRHPKISTVKRWCLPVHSPCLSILCFSVMEHI